MLLRPKNSDAIQARAIPWTRCARRHRGKHRARCMVTCVRNHLWQAWACLFPKSISCTGHLELHDRKLHDCRQQLGFRLLGRCYARRQLVLREVEARRVVLGLLHKTLHQMAIAVALGLAEPLVLFLLRHIRPLQLAMLSRSAVRRDRGQTVVSSVLPILPEALTRHRRGGSVYVQHLCEPAADWQTRHAARPCMTAGDAEAWRGLDLQLGTCKHLPGLVDAE
mmetsp:Transcript_8943/g.22372  ORF Transcript_8943/g.22372 Transcript_8943/m.22372 type:complete len:223 (-) Transcript_8943:604-1272(-)